MPPPPLSPSCSLYISLCIPLFPSLLLFSLYLLFCHFPSVLYLFLSVLILYFILPPSLSLSLLLFLSHIHLLPSSSLSLTNLSSADASLLCGIVFKMASVLLHSQGITMCLCVCVYVCVGVTRISGCQPGWTLL